MANDRGRSNTETVSERVEAARVRVVEPCLFIAFDADHPDGPVSRHALGDVDEVHLRRGAARRTFRQEEGGRRQLILTFADRRVSAVHAFIRRRGSTFIVEDARSKNGTLLDGHSVAAKDLPGECLLEVGHTFLVFKLDVALAQGGERDVVIAAPAATDELSTLSTILERAFRQLADVAKSTLPILVQGETGTGKEAVSQAIHRLSCRGGSFVAVNCGAIPSSLVEAELFGFRKGSFSGATDDRLGLARAAHGGTLFLDEIGDLPLAAQAAFLRVLQDRKVVPIGSVSPVDVDFRLVSATHQNLEELVERGAFREDLLARLDTFSVQLPPLRGRLEDIGTLVARLLTRADGAPLPFTIEAARSLFRHSWPRNVRELAHRLRLALVLASRSGRIEHDHLFAKGAEDQAQRELEARPACLDAVGSATTITALGPEEALRREQIVALLRQHRGNVTAVAQSMGKARAQVQRWMRRYGVDRRTV